MLLFPAALFGGVLAALLCDRCIQMELDGRTLFNPGSCPHCGRKREWWDSIPLLSWLLNGGRCRFCGAALSAREPLLSFMTISLWLLSLQLWRPYGMAAVLPVQVGGSCLLCAAGSDWCGTGERPILLPLLACLGVLGLLFPAGIDIRSRLLGAACMLAFCLMMRALTRKKVGMDTVWYMCCAGLLMGWRSCFAVLPFALLLAALFLLSGHRKCKSMIYRLPVEERDREQKPEALKPAVLLTGGGAAALVFGRFIMKWYLDLFYKIG